MYKDEPVDAAPGAGDLGSSMPTSEDVKEVYARFGLAYYTADVLHRGLCHLYCLAQVPPVGPVTRYRVEEHLRVASQTTLGQLLPLVKDLLPQHLCERLATALERRNFIAHHFWFDRVHLMTTVSGIEVMLTELSQDTQLFQDLDMEVDEVIAPLNGRVGLKPELIESMLDDMRNGRAGVPERLRQQRMLRKQETVVRAFLVPTAAGNSVLTFQTDDGLLWQLCDAGLGWTSHSEPDPTWPMAAKFSSVLPTRINPRPKVSAPWNFEIPFGHRATLHVYTGSNPGQIIYDLRLCP